MGYVATDLVEYMNKNIKPLVSATLRAQHGLISNSIEVKSVETDGYFIISDGKSYFLTFSKPFETIHDFKNELLIHVRTYRNFVFNFTPILSHFFKTTISKAVVPKNVSKTVS